MPIRLNYTPSPAAQGQCYQGVDHNQVSINSCSLQTGSDLYPPSPTTQEHEAVDFLLPDPCHFSTWQVGPAEEASISPLIKTAVWYSKPSEAPPKFSESFLLPSMTSCCPHPRLHLCAHDFSSVDHPAFSSLIFKNMRSPQKVKTTKSTAAFSPLPPLRTYTRKFSGPLSESLWKFHKLNHKQRRRKSDKMRLSGSWLDHSCAKGVLPLINQN